MGAREERRKLGGGCEAFCSSLDCLDAKKQKPYQIYLKKKKTTKKQNKKGVLWDRKILQLNRTENGVCEMQQGLSLLLGVWGT